MESRLSGRVQSGHGDASHWLSKFNTAYSRKLGAPVFPGSLNIALESPFDWFAPEIVRRTISFDRSEYGGERDILLVPCVLRNLAMQPAWLWTPTTAARDRPDPWVVEIIAGTNLRQTFGLADGSIVEVQLGEFMEGTQLDTLRQLAASFRSAIVEARAGKAPGALPYFPEGACRLTSRLFALHLTRRLDSAMFGPAHLVSGVLPGSESGARHYWLELDDAVVDLTADAFGEPAVVVGAPTAFHHALTNHVREAAAQNLASLSADDMARLARQLAAIEQRMPAFTAPPA